MAVTACAPLHLVRGGRTPCTHLQGFDQPFQPYIRPGPAWGSRPGPGRPAAAPKVAKCRKLEKISTTGPLDGRIPHSAGRWKRIRGRNGESHPTSDSSRNGARVGPSPMRNINIWQHVITRMREYCMPYGQHTNHTPLERSHVRPRVACTEKCVIETWAAVRLMSARCIVP